MVAGDDLELLSRSQAAEFLGVSKQTLALWASKGTHGLRFVRVGRFVKYRRSDLEELRQRRPVVPHSTGAPTAAARYVRLAQIRRILARWKDSGLNVRSFCRREHISEVKFYRWRKEVELIDQEEPALDVSASDSVESVNPFVQVVSVPTATTSGIGGILEIVLPTGAIIKVTENTPLDLLCAVLKRMEGKC